MNLKIVDKPITFNDAVIKACFQFKKNIRHRIKKDLNCIIEN